MIRSWLLAVFAGAILAAGCVDYEPAAKEPAGPGAWRPTFSLPSARSGATAFVLPGGEVMIAGGARVFGPGDTFDHGTPCFETDPERWVPTAQLVQGRQIHAGVTLASGTPFVTGGLGPDDVALASTERYDAGVNAWSLAGAMKQARAWHSATLLPSGKVLVAGGYAGNGSADLPLASAELYDPATDTWAFTGSLATARGLHTATLLPSGKVLVVGGCTNGDCSVATPTAEIYDPALGRWADVDPLPSARLGPTATVLSTGEVLLAGGCISNNSCGGEVRSAWLFEPAAGSWTRAADMTYGHALGIAVGLPTGRVLVAAGDNFVGHANPGELYDPATDAWEVTGPMFAWHGPWAAAAPLPGGRVLVVGGSTYDGLAAYAAREAEIWEP